jgi:RNA polymerase-associated protein LEO1
MQSNANIYRWSDGSVTLAVGEDHYEIQNKALAPAPGKPYSEIQDAHYYTAAAHLSSNCLLVVGHLTEQYTVRPNFTVQDDALERMRQKMTEAARAKTDDFIIQTTEDPELAKKQAELAEKERNKAQRRRETAAARMDGASSSRYARGALSIGDLEGGRRGAGAGAAGGRKRGAAGAQSRKRNRNAEYDSDDDLPGGSGRHDEYVLDDFAVASDEEGSEGEEDDEEEILDDEEEEDEDEAPRRKRQRTAEKDDEDADAEADMDDDAPAPASRRRRRVVHDDEDED